MPYDFWKQCSKNTIVFSMQPSIKLGNCSQQLFNVFNKYSVSPRSRLFSINDINWHDMAIDNSFCRFSGHVFKHLKRIKIYLVM